MSCEGLNEIQTFLEEIANEDEEEYLDIKISNLRLDEYEITGEITNWALQYLSHRKSPGILIPVLVKLIVNKVQKECRKSPDCGYDVEKGYDPAVLKQIFCHSIKNFCQNLLDNSEMSRIMSMCDKSLEPPKCIQTSIRNGRRSMEDRDVYIPDFCNVYNVTDSINTHFYGVFDGHGGYNAAYYTVAQLPILLALDPSFPKNPSEALRNSFLETDKNFLKKKVASGTTAVCALYTPDEQKLYVSWVGDSKALLVKNGQVMQIVRCHKPEYPEEYNRIHRLGGSVIKFSGAYRVDGVIGLSRAIGNMSHKPHLTAEPDIVCLELDKNEDFLVIGCDGLWDYVSEEEVAFTVYTQLKSDYEKLDDITERLIKISKTNGSTDNITILIVFFKPPQLISTFSWPFKTMETVADKINGDGHISQETNMNLGNPFCTESQPNDGEEKHDHHHIQTEPLTSDLKEFIAGKFDDIVETAKDFSEKCIIAEDDNQNISPSPMVDDFGPETSVDIMDIKMECQKSFETDLPPHSFEVEPNFQQQEEGEFNLTSNIVNENVNLFGLEKNHDHDKTDFSLVHELPKSPENYNNMFRLTQVLETNENKDDDELASFTDNLKGNQILETLMNIENPIECGKDDVIHDILSSLPECADILKSEQHEENMLGEIEEKIEKQHAEISDLLNEEKPEMELTEPAQVVEEIVTKMEVTANTTSVPESCDESEDEWSYMKLKEGKGEKQSLELDACAETSPVENLEKIDSDKSWQPKESLEKHLDEKPFLPKLDLHVDTEDMAASQLNPDAKEFVPLSSPNPCEEIPNGIFNAAIDLKQQDDVVAQSPRKGAFSMENIQIPSENEFELEIAHRPSEIKDVEFDEPYQELNLKEAMHESEKEEQATSPDELCDNLQPETSVPKSLYDDEHVFDKTDDLMNKVQILPTELIDGGEEISMNGHNDDITAEFCEENVTTPQDGDDLVQDMHVDEPYDNSNEFGFKVEDNLEFDDIATKSVEEVNLFKDSLDQDNEPIEKHFEEDNEKDSFVNEVLETHIKADFIPDLTTGLISNIKKEMEEAKDEILNEFIPQQQSIVEGIQIITEKVKLSEPEECIISRDIDSNKKELEQMPIVEEKSIVVEDTPIADLIIPASMVTPTEEKKEEAIIQPEKEIRKEQMGLIGLAKVPKVEKKPTDPKKTEVKSKLGVTNGIKKVPTSTIDTKLKSSQVTAAKPKAPLTRPRTAPLAPKTSIGGLDKKPLTSATSNKITKTETKPSNNLLTKKPITKVDPATKTTSSVSRTNVITKTTSLTKPTAPASKTARVPLTSTITKTSAQKPLLSPNPKSTTLQSAAKTTSPRTTTVRKTEAVKTNASVPQKTTRTTTTTTVTSKITNAKSTATSKLTPTSGARKLVSSPLTKPQLKKSPTKTGTTPVPVSIPVSNGTKTLDNSIEQK